MLFWDPTDDDIEGFVIDALEALPAPFRDELGSVAIVIEEEASPAQLESVGARGLYGLYQGVPRTRWAADGAPIPSKITIFRGPLVRANRTPGTAGGGRDRHRLSRDRPPFRHLRRAPPRAPGRAPGRLIPGPSCDCLPGLVATNRPGWRRRIRVETEAMCDRGRLRSVPRPELVEDV